ncbi:MAG: GGDEF domain-containing protein [Ruminococcaceae bacterium]|jgi:diguanylate cyclase (GGDEF)-like protein|nr:GGDEF domain-containing protein [Oscillospiraceae bacterium]
MDVSFVQEKNGLPLGKLNYVMAAITLVISALLIFATYRTSNGYERVNEATANYISWEQSASSIQDATDYLTEQARNFVMTGERKYLQNYFLEVNVTRRRESAMAKLKGAGSPEAYEKLEDAMRQSQAQMSLEWYAMRLTISAYGYNPSEFPVELQSTTLLSKDAKLSRTEKQARAQQMVLDSTYLEKKAAIDEDLRAYLTSLEEGTREQQERASDDMRSLLETQRLLVFALIMIFIIVIMMNSFLVINPLMKGILHIRTEQPIPISGSYEFQYLARTYNLMYAANQKKANALAYEASHDKLTGLYNRVEYDELIKSPDMLSSALLLIDVDKFKSVNDTFGHDMGDRVLVHISKVLRESFRSDDMICRIGGDEFATIMVNCGPQFTDLIRGKIERINTKLQNPTDDLPPISVSVGVAFGAEEHGTGNIIKDADLALYQVKEHGRCGVAFFEPSLVNIALPEKKKKD